MVLQKRYRSIVVAVALITGLIAAAPSGGAASPHRASQGGRWSGVWEVEGQTEPGGAFVLFGDFTFRLLTGDEAEAVRLNFGGTCADTDDVYRFTWEFGGGGAGEACEIASLGNHLFGEYYGNDGGWGEFDNEYVGGPIWSWEGDYSPPSFDPNAPSNVTLLWRGKAKDQCPSRVAARAAQCDGEARTVRFNFEQGGLPKERPRTLVDVRTVGRGSVTYLFDPEDPEEEELEVEEFSGNVVRELDYAVDSGTDIKTRGLKLRVDEADDIFRYSSREEDLAPQDPTDTAELYIDLVVVDSSDSRCSEKANDGRQRRAKLFLLQAFNNENLDVVKLTVAGCPHHNYTFKGRNKVNVRIVS